MRVVSLFLLTVAGCAVASPEDGPASKKGDAKHDLGTETSASDDTGAVIDDAGDDGAIADSSDDGAGDASIDSSIDDTAVPDTTPPPLVCADDEYDVDGDPSNGCEVKDTEGNHSKDSAFDLGRVDECDSSYGWFSHSGKYPSDDRTHTSGALGTLGRADYLVATHVSKTFCLDDPTYQISISGGKGNYRVTVYRHGDLSQIDTKCSPTSVGGAETTKDYLCTGQDDGEKAIIKIEKTSGPAENVSYTLKYHN